MDTIKHSHEQARASRPRLPPSYGIVDAAHGSGLLPWKWVTDRMSQARTYWIGTTRPSGAPHVTPVWGLWLNGAFSFATDRNSRKGRNIAHSPRMVLHLESGEDVVILEGVAEEVTKAAALKQFAEAYAAKYQVEVDVTPEARRVNAVFVVRPRTAYAWLESDYPGGATRWEF
ncbi:MAG: pyridoxamine 5'-phosphate oxidase family protein [Chloroflexi bacterium]|nr:pyridoxamine 5'-phosphate oxidase family protein [Chloroflexota bacterium]